MARIDMAATGKKIRDLRVKAGMTIKDIQDACGGNGNQCLQLAKREGYPHSGQPGNPGADMEYQD